MKSIIVITACLITHVAMACDNSDITQRLYTDETNALLAHAPTFKQAWDEKAITLTLENPKHSAESCVADMQLTLPQKDLDEVKQYLDNNPAKRILLAAQGYSVPEQAATKLPLHYENNGKRIDTREYKQLHNSLEYMYQLLAQIRSEVKPDQKNDITWGSLVTGETTQDCTTRYIAQDTTAACDCRTQALQKTVAPKQMTLILFIQKQPYAYAAGALDSFGNLDKQLTQQCGLQTRALK